MQRISREKAIHYVFDHRSQPVLTVEPGEHFLVETRDALSGKIQSEKDLLTPENMKPYSEYEPALSNPLSGPVLVRGVECGDLLAIYIDEVIPAGNGVTAIKPGQGGLCHSNRWSIHVDPITRIIHHQVGPSGTFRDGKAVFSDTMSWDIQPFIGTIGVAPQIEVETSAVGQGIWGGNWDCRDMCSESILFLNVYHDGALLFIGDVHGSQGDGEWSGVANEMAADVLLRCEVIKRKKIPCPRIEKPGSLVCFVSDRPLEVAIERAMECLLEWIVDEYGMDPREAYMLFSVCPDFRINVYQMVKLGSISYTAGAEFPKKYLPKN